MIERERARCGDRDRSAGTRTAAIAIFADESCLGNGREGSNPGGAAGVIEYVSPETGNLTRYDYWISEPARRTIGWRCAA